MRIGIDVGGTNTDAVLMEGSQLLASHKAPTTPDVSSGIVEAIQSLLNEAGKAPAQITSVMIGTTHFTNAFVERRELLKVGVIRIALPATTGLLPFVDWPDDIRAAVRGDVHLVHGGYQFDGRPNSKLDELAIAGAARKMRGEGLTSFAIAGVFSPLNSAMEERAAQILLDTVPDAAVSLSHRIGRIGILERENAAIMNASLAALSKKVVASFGDALRRIGISAPFYISQNDGTLMSADQVARYPVLTFASGPTNSMRGAAHMTGQREAMVIDVGGTTSDIGMLSNGFPRESAISADIGGVRTNFRMPDVWAIGLGGGTLVDPSDGAKIGPKSVGFRLRESAYVFGGNTLTATDIAVAAGRADIGDRRRVEKLPANLVRTALARMDALLGTGIERMKTSPDPVPTLLVGGGAVLFDENIPGASQVLRPENSGVANAIGAAIAQVGGETDKVYYYTNTGRDASLEQARMEACEQAVAAGADPASVQIVDLEEIPLAYVPGGAVRIRVKAAGDLAGKIVREPLLQLQGERGI
jgi:N-methylhydantoinase A/oxoprolinase/acetone carboxylase beta subunit